MALLCKRAACWASPRNCGLWWRTFAATDNFRTSIWLRKQLFRPMRGRSKYTLGGRAHFNSVHQSNSYTSCSVWRGPLTLTIKYVSLVSEICRIYHSPQATGQVFSCGDQTSGQTGVPSECCHFVPKRIDALYHVEIRQISCGSRHSLFVDGTLKLQLRSKTKPLWYRL